MRGVFTAIGTTGDVQPMLALAEEFRRHGDEAVFALPWNLVEHARRAGFRAEQVGPDLSETFDPLQREYSRGEVSKEASAAYSAAIAAAIPEMMGKLHELTADADVLLGTDGVHIGRLLGELTGIPYVSVQICFPQKEMLDGTGVAQAPDEGLNAIRVAVGLQPLPDRLQHSLSTQLALFEVSPELLVPGPGWPEHHRTTGFMFRDVEDFTPEPGLAAFFAAGAKPIVIDLGSTTYDDPGRLTELLLTAVGRAGVRAVVLRGWARLGSPADEPDVYFTGYTPHTWLFPRASAVVCHGGCGTIAEAYRAGVPTVVIPAAHDHFRFVDRVREAGWSREVIPFKELDAERLAASIRRATTDAGYAAAARRLRSVVEADHGTRVAYREIQRMLEHTPRGVPVA
jgi:sterol 3beta-glucosyltransferase